MKPRSALMHSSMSAPSASEETSVSEPLLSWGSSVNVNEDLRRSIRKEIEDVDESIDTLQSNIKNEDRTSTQLAKDFAHARTEMVQLRRGAADKLDGETMKDQVRHRLKASLRSELMSPTSVVSSSHSTLESSSQEGKETDASGKDKPPATLGAYLQQRANELKVLASFIAKEKEFLMQSKAEKDDLEHQTETILGRIEAGKLLEELEASKKESAYRSEEYDKEERHKRATKEAVQKVRAQSGHYAQQIADQVSIVSSSSGASHALLTRHFSFTDEKSHVEKDKERGPRGRTGDPFEAHRGAAPYSGYK